MTPAEQANDALTMLNEHISRLFPDQVAPPPRGDAVDPANPPKLSVAPTGERYTEIVPIKTRIGAPTAMAVARLMIAAFDEYAAGRSGVLYWRVEPEIQQYFHLGWKGYMRLLISDKPPQPKES
jgi:hypothetical protein